MVFKLKELEEDSPGIIIFSHKEFVKYSKYKTFNKILKAYKRIIFSVYIGELHMKTLQNLISKISTSTFAIKNSFQI